MSDANVIPLKTHLKAIAQRAKIRTNEQLVEFANATAAALEEMDSVKADKSSVETANAKVTADINALNNTKANKADITTMLNLFNTLGLCLDADGDLAQK